ncbi:MAG: hypothetical protein KAU14_10045 [Thermoplasmata archaeon]|nr:hypothetical protein [Thermoplasmata archaeon]
MDNSLLSTIQEQLKYGTHAEKEYIITTLKKMIEVDISIQTKEMRNLRKTLEEFEEKYNMSSDEFVRRFNNGEMGDDREFIRWYAYKDAYNELEKRCNELRNHID